MRHDWNAIELIHDRAKIIEGKRLLSIAHCFCRVWMDFHQQAVRADRLRGAAKRTDPAPYPNAMAWIDEDRQVRSLAQDRNRRKIERVARRRLERANTSLAQDHI